jgi:outer membrane protein TolC
MFPWVGSHSDLEVSEVIGELPQIAPKKHPSYIAQSHYFAFSSGCFLRVRRGRGAATDGERPGFDAKSIFLVLALLTAALPVRAQGSTELPFPLTIGVHEAIDRMLANAKAGGARMDLGDQLKLAAGARREFLPQVLLSAQSERTGEGSSSSSELQTTWRFRTGASLSASVGRSVMRGPVQPATSGRTDRITTQSLELSQPLLRGSGVEAATIGERQADLAASSARRDFAEALANLVFDTVNAYFALEQARRNLDLAHETISRLGKMRAVNEALLAAGRIPRTTLSQNDLDAAQAKLALARAEQVEMVAKRTLLRLTADNLHDTDAAQIILRDSFAGHAAAAVPSEREAIAMALNRRGDVGRARDSVASARLRLASARDAARDQLDVYTKLDRQRSALPAAETTVSTVGLRFSIALDKTSWRDAVAAASLGLDKAELLLSEVERTVSAETRDALKAIDFAKAQQWLAQRTAELAERHLDDEVERTRAGRSSAIELAQAQDALRDARAQETQARYGVFTAQLDLQRATGTILERWGAAGQVETMQMSTP